MMNELKLHRSETTAANGEAMRLVYNESDDMLDIFWGENGPATGIELTRSHSVTAQSKNRTRHQLDDSPFFNIDGTHGIWAAEFSIG